MKISQLLAYTPTAPATTSSGGIRISSLLNGTFKAGPYALAGPPSAVRAMAQPPMDKATLSKLALTAAQTVEKPPKINQVFNKPKSTFSAVA